MCFADGNIGTTFDGRMMGATINPNNFAIAPAGTGTTTPTIPLQGDAESKDKLIFYTALGLDYRFTEVLHLTSKIAYTRFSYAPENSNTFAAQTNINRAMVSLGLSYQIMDL